MTGAARAAFVHQAKACEGLGSPFMGRLMRLCAENLAPGGAVADRILGWSGDLTSAGDAVPLRLAGGLHALARQGDPALSQVYPPHTTSDAALWDAVQDAMTRRAEVLSEWLLRPPQTNEVRRAATVIPAMHLVAARTGLPLRLVEFGCSAGLNLLADRFRLTAGDATFGPADAPVALIPDWSGTAPPAADLRVTHRTGLDIAPLDPVADRERLLAYLWADQPDRIRLTDAAIGLAQTAEIERIAGDGVDWLRNNLRPSPGETTFLFHTIAWQYLPASARARAEAFITEAGAKARDDAPMARFSMEPGEDKAALRLQIWPGGAQIDLGRADYHGRWVVWQDPDETEV